MSRLLSGVVKLFVWIDCLPCDERKVASGEWRVCLVVDAKLRVENGEWRVTSEEWSVENGE